MLSANVIGVWILNQFFQQGILDSRSIDNEGSSSCSSASDVNVHSRANVDQPLSYQDFLAYVLNALVDDKKWMNLDSVIFDRRRLFVAKDYGSAEKLLVAATDTTVEGERIIVAFESNENKPDFCFYRDKDDYTRYTADKALGRIKGNRDEFKKFCESQLLLIQDSDKNGVLPTRRTYVQVHGVN